MEMESLIVDGGQVISAAQPVADSSLDSNSGTFVNGGIVYAVGTSMDMAEQESEQPTMNLIWKENVDANSSVKIKDENGNEIIKYNERDEEFIDGTLRKSYVAVIVSHLSFIVGKVYHIYMN